MMNPATLTGAAIFRFRPKMSPYAPMLHWLSCRGHIIPSTIIALLIFLVRESLVHYHISACLTNSFSSVYFSLLFQYAVGWMSRKAGLLSVTCAMLRAHLQCIARWKLHGSFVRHESNTLPCDCFRLLLIESHKGESRTSRTPYHRCC